MSPSTAPRGLATCSATECCCCTILSMTSVAFAAAFLTFPGALLLKNMSTSVFADIVQKGPKELSRCEQPQAEGFQVRMPFENRTAQTRTATTMEPRSASHSVYGAVSGISFPTDSRIAAPTSTLSLPSPYPATVCEEEFGQLYSMGTRASKKSSGVAFQSHKWL